MPSDNRSLAQEWWDRLGHGDVAVDLWHPQARIENARGWPVEAVYQGRDGVRQWFEDIREAFDDFGVELLEVIDLKDGRVLTFQRFIGHFRTTGIEFDGPWASIVTLEDGMMMHAIGYLSRREAMKAAGLE